MKTLIYLPTLLALTIQVMVNGQTQGNQTYKVRVDIMGSKEPVKMKYVNSNITLTIEEYNQLLEQANVLKVNAAKLKEEAESAEQIYLNKQLEASVLSGKIALHEFDENKKTIVVLFSKIPKNTPVYTSANVINVESERLMKLAKEMREEANAQQTLYTKIANMSNAEEKETLALLKQNVVLAMLDKSIEKTTEESNTEIVNSYLEINITDKANERLMESLFETYTQAENVKITAQQLRETAQTASPNEKEILIKEAVSLENEYLFKKMEVSNIKAQLNYDKFAKNRLMIAQLVSKIKNNEALVETINQLNNEAERLFKMGKEMREEANAQATVAAKYGAMSNAEETDVLAINKQQESIQTFDKINSQLVIASR